MATIKCMRQVRSACLSNLEEEKCTVRPYNHKSYLRLYALLMGNKMLFTQQDKVCVNQATCWSLAWFDVQMIYGGIIDAVIITLV